MIKYPVTFLVLVALCMVGTTMMRGSTAHAEEVSDIELEKFCNVVIREIKKPARCWTGNHIVKAEKGVITTSHEWFCNFTGHVVTSHIECDGKKCWNVPLAVCIVDGGVHKWPRLNCSK